MRRPTSELRPLMDSRLWHWRGAIVGLSFLLCFGLFYYQLLHVDRYVDLAMNNRLRVLRLPRVRGEIFDRTGHPLALNVTTFDLLGYPLDLTDGVKEGLLQALDRNGLEISREELEQRITRRYWAPYRAITLVSDLTMTQMTGLLNDPTFPPELFPQTRQRRAYPAGPLTSHVVGQVGEISEAQLKSDDLEGYQGGDILGKDGVEKTYESWLRGQPGERVMEVDARGRPRGQLNEVKPKQGRDLQLTIDLGAQQFASELLGDYRGAAVAMDVQTGELLVLYSNPSYDPNPLSWGLTAKEWQNLMNNPARPLLNRAITGQYSPGSIWKALTGYAALSHHAIDKSTRFRCSGAFKLGAQTYRCWRRGGHGYESILTALRDSCDVFFYETSQKVGIDHYLASAKKFGLDKATGVDLPGEASGNLAGPDWKKKRKLGPWFKGDTVNYSIGQGYLLLTPLQMASLYATIANGGMVVQPHLNKEFKIKPRDPKLDKEALALIAQGLKMVTAKGGTGARASNFGVAVSGKTGTVQNPHGEDHAVFAGFAPSDNPRYVAVFFLEAGKSGGRNAAPMVGQLLAYLVRSEEGRKK